MSLLAWSPFYTPCLSDWWVPFGHIAHQSYAPFLIRASLTRLLMSLSAPPFESNIDPKYFNGVTVFSLSSPSCISLACSLFLAIISMPFELVSPSLKFSVSLYCYPRRFAQDQVVCNQHGPRILCAEFGSEHIHDDDEEEGADCWSLMQAHFYTKILCISVPCRYLGLTVFTHIVYDFIKVGFWNNFLSQIPS